MGFITDNRIGCFTVSQAFFTGDEEIPSALFKDFVPWAVDRDTWYSDGRLRFVGFHPAFEPIDVACVIPEYEVLIHDNLIEGSPTRYSVEFKKKE